MITSRQIRAARALLGWTQEMLADTALVALTALKRLESERHAVRDVTRDAVCKALEDHGIIFHSSAQEIGVTLVRQRENGTTGRTPANTPSPRGARTDHG